MSHFSLFNRLSIYWDSFMHTVNTEYWRGHRRKKVATVGPLTIWTRGV